MDLQDVSLLLPRGRFYTTFLRNCGRGESHATGTCIKTMVGSMQRYVRCKIVLL